MYPTLLEEFLEQEATPNVRELLRDAMEAGRSGAGPRRWEFNFDRFDVTFDLDEGDVLIQDDLDVTEAGSRRIPVAEFLAALRTVK